MHVIRADSGVIVTLPLAQTDPWPGPVPVAMAIPAVLVGGIALGAAGVLGDMSAWLVGAAPMASLFVPLFWLVRRSRTRTATLVLDTLGLRIVHDGRAPEFRGDSLNAAVAWDRLSIEGGGNRVELELAPLDGEELTTLREVLRELTLRARSSGG